MENELRTNAKKANPEQQYEIRKSIIRLLKSGKNQKETAQILDVSYRHVCAVKKAYAASGIAGIKPQKRGRRVGEKRTLKPEQEQEIRKILVDKTPEQLRFRECMWTRKNIRALIKEKYHIEMPLSSLGYYLGRWGFSMQRPKKQAYQQDEQKVKNWLNIEFPGISKRAKAEKAEIFFGDETGIQNTANYARGYIHLFVEITGFEEHLVMSLRECRIDC